MLTTEEIIELKAKIAAGKAEREQRLKAFNSEASALRLQNEARLVDIECKEKLTLGIDLGVVWCPDGSMCVIRKPELIDYEKFQNEIGEADAKEKARLLDEYLKPSLVYPKPGRDFDELCERYGEVRGAATVTINAMHDVNKEDTAGKS
jgi:hypothetical protein